MPKTPKIVAGFVQSYRGNDAAGQEERLRALGVRKIYSPAKGETPENALGPFRAAGEVLGIAGTLRVFGDTRKAIRAAVDMFAAKGIVILDVDSGKRSDRDGIAMLDEAWSAKNAERRVPDLKKAALHGAQGGKEKGRLARGRRMPMKEAKRLWRSPDLTAEQALELMHGWTRETAYRYLHRRNRPSGRPPMK